MVGRVMVGQETSWRQNLNGGRQVPAAVAAAVAAGALVVAGLIGPRIGRGDTAPPMQPQRPAFNEAAFLERRLLAEERALGD